MLPGDDARGRVARVTCPRPRGRRRRAPRPAPARASSTKLARRDSRRRDSRRDSGRDSRRPHPAARAPLRGAPPSVNGAQRPRAALLCAPGDDKLLEGMEGGLNAQRSRRTKRSDSATHASAACRAPRAPTSCSAPSPALRWPHPHASRPPLDPRHHHRCRRRLHQVSARHGSEA